MSYFIYNWIIHKRNILQQYMYLVSFSIWQYSTWWFKDMLYMLPSLVFIVFENSWNSCGDVHFCLACMKIAEGVKPLIHFFKMFESTWPFCLKFTFPTPYIFLYVLSKYNGIFKVLQWNTMLWSIPYSKNRNVTPRNSVFIGHASRPP